MDWEDPLGTAETGQRTRRRRANQDAFRHGPRASPRTGRREPSCGPPAATGVCALPASVPRGVSRGTTARSQSSREHAGETIPSTSYSSFCGQFGRGPQSYREVTPSQLLFGSPVWKLLL